MAAGTLVGPVARAHDTDELFWASAQYFGLPLTRNAAISVAKTMCSSFRSGDETVSGEVAWLADWGKVSEYKAGDFVGSAISSYLP